MRISGFMHTLATVNLDVCTPVSRADADAEGRHSAALLFVRGSDTFLLLNVHKVVSGQ
jgi:hypothetical protein